MKYFRFRNIWFFIYLIGTIVLIAPSMLLMVLTLGVFSPMNVLDDWVKYCLDKHGYD